MLPSSVIVSPRPLLRALLIALALGTTAAARAQSVPEASTLVRVNVAPVDLAAGGTARARIALTVEPGWHINANPPSLDYMIPTEVTVKPAGGITPGRAATTACWRPLQMNPLSRFSASSMRAGFTSTLKLTIFRPKLLASRLSEPK